MPGKPWPSNLFEEMKRLRTQRTWTEPRPVYVATGLVVLAAVLMLVVVSGVKQPAVPVPTTPQARHETSLEPVTRSEAPKLTQVEKKATDKPLVGTATEPAPAAPLRNEKPRRPINGTTTVAFGWQLNPVYSDWRYHPGVDIAAPAGDIARAMWGGRVTEIYEDRQYGLTVVVVGNDHTVYYGSLAAVKVDKNRQLVAGAPVGTVGEAPGERYPHLHLAVKSGDRYVDPTEFLVKSE